MSIELKVHTTHKDLVEAILAGSEQPVDWRNVCSIRYVVNFFTHSLLVRVNTYDGKQFSWDDFVQEEHVTFDRRHSFLFEEELASTPYWKFPSMTLDLDGDVVDVEMLTLRKSSIDWRKSEIFTAANMLADVGFGSFVVYHPAGFEQAEKLLGCEIEKEGSIGYPCMLHKRGDKVIRYAMPQAMVNSFSGVSRRAVLSKLTYAEWEEACRLANQAEVPHLLTCKRCASKNPDAVPTFYPAGTTRCPHDGNMTFEKHPPNNYNVILNVLGEISEVFY